MLEQVRNQARTAVASAWVTNEGTKIALTAAESEVRAADVALQGARCEAQGGQRTTIDVLNAQQDLTNARSRQIQAQHDRVIASYTLLSSVGKLDVHTLNLGISARRTISRRFIITRYATPGTGSGRRPGNNRKLERTDGAIKQVRAAWAAPHASSFLQRIALPVPVALPKSRVEIFEAGCAFKPPS